MRRYFITRISAIVVGILFITVRPASVAAAEINGVEITNADRLQMLTALHTAFKPNDDSIPIHVSIKSSSEMPAYSQDSYYAGIQEPKPGVRNFIVWVNSDLKGTAGQHAIEKCFFLALADGGYGGNVFKQLYDDAAAKDAQLPPNSPNPYLNRSELGTKLVDVIVNQ